MEAFVALLTVYLAISFAGRAELITIGSKYPDFESEKYESNSTNSYLKFRINTMENKIVPLRLYIRIQNSPPEKFYKVYRIPINKNLFIRNNYSKNNTEGEFNMPSEIKENPSTFFYTDCDYLIPLPPGSYLMYTGDYKTGIAKAFQSMTSSSPEFTIEPDQIFDIKLENYYDKMIFGKSKIIPTPSDIKEIKKCKID